MTTSAKPAWRLNKAAVTSAAEFLGAEREVTLGREGAHGRGIAADDQHVALGQGRTLERAAGIAGLNSHQGDARVGREIDGVGHGAEVGRA